MSARAEAAAPVLSLDRRESPVPNTPWHVLVYAHTHWDREWYQSFERFRMQLVGCVDRVIELLQSDDRFSCFVLDGQTIVLDDYLAIRPEQRSAVAELTAAGRLEVGPWYILPDEFLISPESLVRNLLFGRRGAAAFGGAPRVGYLPDPFGHLGMIPTILNGFGIDTAVFSRGMGDEFHQLGTEFTWRAPDGEGSVLALVQTSPYTNGYCNAELASIKYGDAPGRAASELPRLASHLAERSNTGVLLFAAGCDHAYPHAGLIDHLQRLREELPGVQVEIAGMRRYRELVHDRVGQREEPLGTYSGELRGALHAPILAAIFSARVELKQENVQLQDELERVVEPLMSLTPGMASDPVYQGLLRHAWSLVLRNQPHDSIGGCSVDAVHDEMRARSLRALELARGIVEEIAIRRGYDGSADLVFNPHPAVQRGLVWLDSETARWVEELPPLGLVPVDSHVRDGGARVVDSDAIEAAGVRVAVVDGEIRVTLQPGHGGALASGLPVTGEAMLGFIDEADAGDEYDFGAVPGDSPRRASLVSHSTHQESGVAYMDLVHELQLPVSLNDARTGRSERTVLTRLHTRLTIAGDDAVVHAHTRWTNHASDHRLRLAVRAPRSADRVVADAHWHHLERPGTPPAHGDDWKQIAPPSNHLHRWVAVPAGTHGPGVGVATCGLHEYELVPGGAPTGEPELRITIQRSVGWLSRDDIEGRPGHAGPGLSTPGAQGLGERSVRYHLALTTSTDLQHSVLPHQLARAAVGLRHVPAIPEEIRIQSGHRARAWAVEAEQGSVPDSLALGLRGAELSACKPADDGSGDVVVRAWNPQDAASDVTLVLPDGWDVIEPVRLDELPAPDGSPLTLAHGTWTGSIPGRAVRSWRLRPLPTSSGHGSLDE